MQSTAPARHATKPLAARQVEAQGRARRDGVRVVVVRDRSHYLTRSQSRPGVVHSIERTRAGWACDCEGFAFSGMCKHIGQVARRADREGWAFGTVARPSAPAAAPMPTPDVPPAPPAGNGPWVWSERPQGDRPPFLVTYAGPGPSRPHRRFWTAAAARTECDVLNRAEARRAA